MSRARSAAAEYCCATSARTCISRLGGQERVYRCANEACRYEHRKLVML